MFISSIICERFRERSSSCLFRSSAKVYLWSGCQRAALFDRTIDVCDNLIEQDRDTYAFSRSLSAGSLVDIDVVDLSVKEVISFS